MAEDFSSLLGDLPSPTENLSLIGNLSSLGEFLPSLVEDLSSLENGGGCFSRPCCGYGEWVWEIRFPEILAYPATGPTFYSSTFTFHRANLTFIAARTRLETENRD